MRCLKLKIKYNNFFWNYLYKEDEDYNESKILCGLNFKK